METEQQKVDSVSLVSKYIQKLKPYLSHKVEVFQAGAISNYFAEWQKLTSDFEVLNSVSGLSLDFIEIPSVSGNSFESHFSKHEHVFIQNEISRLVKKGVIKESFH